MRHKVAYWCLPRRGHKGTLLTHMHREKSMSGTAGKEPSTGLGEASVETKPESSASRTVVHISHSVELLVIALGSLYMAYVWEFRML